MEEMSCVFKKVSRIMLIGIIIYRLHSLIPTFMKWIIYIFISVSNVGTDVIHPQRYFRQSILML
jgi:hypothetical protein